MQQAMNPMMMMMMMNSMGGGSGSSGAASKEQTEMMLRTMMPELFEDESENLWNGGVTVGSARINGMDGIGVLSVLVMPPTIAIDKATMRVSMHAPIKLTRNADTWKKELELIAKQFLAWSKDDDLEKAFNDAISKEAEMQPKKREADAMKAVMS